MNWNIDPLSLGVQTQGEGGRPRPGEVASYYEIYGTEEIGNDCFIFASESSSAANHYFVIANLSANEAIQEIHIFNQFGWITSPRTVRNDGIFVFTNKSASVAITMVSSRIRPRMKRSRKLLSSTHSDGLLPVL